IGAPHAWSGLAAIGAMRASGAYVLHLPGARLVAVRARSQRTHRADVNAHAAFFAIQVVALVRSDDGTHTAILNAEGGYLHAFVAYPHAAVAQNAARPVEVHHR